MKRLTLMLLLTCVVVAPTAVADDEPLSLSLHNLGSALLNYVPNRAHDLLDIAHASVGFGLGYGLNIRATNQLGMCASDYSTLRFGLKERGPWVWDEAVSEGGAALGPFTCGETERDPAELGVGIHVGLIGADAAVDLYEVADCVLGLLLIDISQDDVGPTIASRERAYP